ncbi:MAG: hypothetical protein R6V19_06505 [Armatimonadota bacterium]
MTDLKKYDEDYQDINDHGPAVLIASHWGEPLAMFHIAVDDLEHEYCDVAERLATLAELPLVTLREDSQRESSTVIDANEHADVDDMMGDVLTEQEVVNLIYRVAGRGTPPDLSLPIIQQIDGETRLTILPIAFPNRISHHEEGSDR